jgi:hypothetical protein
MAKTQERITRATEGMELTLKHGPSGTPAKYTVGPKCEHNFGNWVCVTHGKAFLNQFEKDSHISERTGPRGKHVLAWLCAHHGPEVP